jgi:hypothetical protein
MMNGRPLGARKKVQLMVILTILAWATQTLFHQWGYGAQAPMAPGAEAARAASEQQNLKALIWEAQSCAQQHKARPSGPRRGASLQTTSRIMNLSLLDVRELMARCSP